MKGDVFSFGGGLQKGQLGLSSIREIRCTEVEGCFPRSLLSTVGVAERMWFWRSEMKRGNCVGVFLNACLGGSMQRFVQVRDRNSEGRYWQKTRCIAWRVPWLGRYKALHKERREVILELRTGAAVKVTLVYDSDSKTSRKSGKYTFIILFLKEEKKKKNTIYMSERVFKAA